MHKVKKLNSLNILISFACLVLISFGLKQAKIVFIPLFLAYIIYIILNPISNYLNNRFSISKKFYNGVMLFIFIIFSFLFFKYIFSSINLLINELDIYSKEFNRFIQNNLGNLQNSFPHLKVKEILTNEITAPVTEVIRATSLAINNFGQIIILTLTCSLFFLFDSNSVIKIKKSIFFSDLQNRLRHYIIIKTISSLVTAAIISVYLIIMGYKFVLFLGVATFILNFIPSFGSLIAALLLVPVFGMGAQSSSDVLIPLIFPSLVQFGIGNLIEPKFMGEALELSSIIIILSLIYWGIIFGFYGLFLGVPLSLVVKTLISSSDFKDSIYN